MGFLVFFGAIVGFAALASLSMAALRHRRASRFRGVADALGLTSEQAHGGGVVRTGTRSELEVKMSLLQRERGVTRRVQGGGPFVRKNLAPLHTRRERRTVYEWWTRIEVQLVQSPEGLSVRSAGSPNQGSAHTKWFIGSVELEARYEFAAADDAEEVGRAILSDADVQRALRHLSGGPFTLQLQGRVLSLECKGGSVSRSTLSLGVERLVALALALDSATRRCQPTLGAFR